MNFKRVISALTLFPLLIIVLFKAPYYILGFLILITAFLCFYEWSNLYSYPLSLYLLGEGLLILALLYSFFFSSHILLIFYFFFFFSFSFFIFQFEKTFFQFFFFSLLVGLFFLFIGLFSLWEVLQSFGRKPLIYFFSVVFGNDTGAYLIGKTLGKRPFFSSISPKKTKEGFLGGMALALIMAILLNNWLNLFYPFYVNLLVAFTLALGGSIGDLFESALKRVAGKKDSGKLIPGHGGLLDRIDGVLFSSPLYYIMLNLLKE
ncbi:MAG: phosphatidate cytidylyltransferase [Thermodesulfobacteriaceae bacterium]|nr:phosphatidate cytidylyltransferase [Thermodesulfobacteriaceae bacterium]MCX8042014.1 phosphatidate cytidylyltransferase [Thermodesulfobacteriaceae bacterium]MDW8136422.1 phosphatidate cytidylyltransferase [Thermodesulfobacterium sp.]